MSDFFDGNLKIIRDVEVEWVRKLIVAEVFYTGLTADKTVREVAEIIVDRYARMIESCAKQKLMGDPPRVAQPEPAAPLWSPPMPDM